MKRRTKSFVYSSIALLLSILLTTSLFADNASTAFLKLQQTQDNNIQGSWSIQYTDIMRLVKLDLDGDHQILWWEVIEQRRDIEQLLRESLLFYSDQDKCDVNMHLLDNEDAVLEKMLTVDFTVTCGNNSTATNLTYAFLAGIDPLHKCVFELNRLQSAAQTQAQRSVMSATNNSMSLKWRSQKDTFANFILYGIKHILTGWDHIAFLLTLVLSTVIAKNKPITYSFEFKRLAIYVGMFTLAHCMALLANLISLTLPARLTESLITIGIAWSAWCVIKLHRPPAYWLVFAFALAHAVGFSSVLTQWHQHSDSRIVLQLGFNLGIELGQLIIIALMLLLIQTLSRSQLFDKCRRAIAFGVLGISAIWFFERVLGLSVPGAFEI